MEFETLTADDIEELLSGKKIKKADFNLSNSNKDNTNKDTKDKSSVPNTKEEKNIGIETKNKNPRPSEV